MLDQLLGRLLTPQGAGVLGPQLQTILFALAECVEVETGLVESDGGPAGDDLAPDHPVVNLMLRLALEVGHSKAWLAGRCFYFKRRGPYKLRKKAKRSLGATQEHGRGGPGGSAREGEGERVYCLRCTKQFRYTSSPPSITQR